jgi:hypothetical protein
MAIFLNSGMRVIGYRTISTGNIACYSEAENGKRKPLIIRGSQIQPASTVHRIQCGHFPTQKMKTPHFRAFQRNQYEISNKFCLS